MKKGTFQKSVEVKPAQGKMDTAKPAGGEVKFGYTPAGRKGTKA